MNNKVLNKKIKIKSIIDIANYFDDYKNRYDNIFEQEKIKNQNLEYSDRKYEYENGSTELRYTIKLRNGKNMTETDYNWFLGQLGRPQDIEEVYLELRVSYYNSDYNRINVTVDFRDAGMNLKYSEVYIDVQTTNQEREANNIYSTVMNMLENNEDRYNKTIKSKNARIQSFCISIGIVLSYILWLVLNMNMDKIPVEIATILTNKYLIIFGQWFVAILLGNLFVNWYILSIYRPLLPDTKYAGYNSSTYKSVYKDDIDDYIEHCEVHIGKYWDAEKRRNKIEMIYKITSKVVLVQLLISIVLFLILK